MKALKYISILSLLVFASCSSTLYTGVEYDDLYYLPSDKPAAPIKKNANIQLAERNLKVQDYYDNIYAADTLVSDEFVEAVNDSTVEENYPHDYSDDFYSYSGRLRRFHDSYFYPYWRDPYYDSWGYPYITFGYGFPYYYDPFYYSPFMYDFGYYGRYYGGYWGNYWCDYHAYPYYHGSYYYGPGGYYSYNREKSSIPYGRRERQSNYSSNWNRNIPVSSSSRRGSYVAREAGSTGKSTTRDGSAVQETSRTLSGGTSRRDINGTPALAREATAKSQTTPATRSEIRSRQAPQSRPSYSSANRTYTPSYSNPRLTTRAPYNNTRVPGSTVRPGQGNGNGSRTTENRAAQPAQRGNTISSSQSRPAAANPAHGSYSAPSRRAVQSGSGISSGNNYNRSSSYGSGSGSSSSSHSSGSSYSGHSGSSRSSGSSSGSSGSGSSSRSSSSSGSRR
jgi:hypothetical protein